MSQAETPLGIDDLRDLIGELRSMARQLLSLESKAHSLTPTALAMTALRRAKLADSDWEEVRWENRRHFFAAIACAMRRALVDYARRRRSRGRDRVVYVSPEENLFRDLADGADDRPEHFLCLDEALSSLAEMDSRLADVLHQHYFLGYSAPEIARTSECSERTVDRDLKRARILVRKLYEERSRA